MKFFLLKEGVQIVCVILQTALTLVQTVVAVRKHSKQNHDDTKS